MGSNPAGPISSEVTSRKGDKGHLIAFDALSLRELWSIAMPLPAHFVPPTIADGKVLVVTEHATLQICDLPE